MESMSLSTPVSQKKKQLELLEISECLETVQCLQIVELLEISECLALKLCNFGISSDLRLTGDPHPPQQFVIK